MNYAAALFLIASVFAGVLSALENYPRVVANLPSDPAGRLELARTLAHSRLFFAVPVALIGIAFRLMSRPVVSLEARTPDAAQANA
ncbi:hypothetical protein FHW79_006061 [Azospirillum sp. OGB3]|uniref:hypothetical protein n=1 Tax=Azospirillum sp. OGB3 TaxID=2587012 RepID=UPI0016068497|nr:hypothetical protein [Azospirillum sp. OGB3]MBB3268386.1 hypothetical protein [Azospirillum sp. OGB3]